MKPRKHANQIIVWANNRDAAVYVRNFGGWSKVPVSPIWEDALDYVVVPKWADEYWQAWLAGTLYKSRGRGLWRRVVEPPLFVLKNHWKIENYEKTC